ncbi:MAG: PorV/PorQ family protein [Bacteroidetes bacterium]|nr:PorV/PorQ family protein [Bacteroidota bacterium]MBU1117028.1 PorV/PorQ family protein [Bacteroidota bacterium]MBU1797623.1 PorV/PorQ family protein [Bacteroidota bacterium]
MKFIKYVLIFTLLQLLLNVNIFAFEKVGTTSFQFLKVIPTARAVAMGGAYSTIGVGSESIFWNPAGLTTVSNFDAAVSYLDWFMDATQYSFSAAYKVEGIGTIGIMGMMADVGEIKETKVSYLGYQNGVYNPGLTGNTFNPKSIVFGLSYAKDLNDRFTFGLNLKYAYEDLIYYGKGAIIFDGGMLFKTGFKSIVVGASIRNFGQEIIYLDKNYPLPQTLNIGISAYLFSDDNSLFAKLQDHSLLLSTDIIQPRDYNQQYAVGLEYSFSKMLYLRSGYLFNDDNKGINLGAGISYKGTNVDYAFSNHGDFLGSVHRISISVSLK